MFFYSLQNFFYFLCVSHHLIFLFYYLSLSVSVSLSLSICLFLCLSLSLCLSLCLSLSFIFPPLPHPLPLYLPPTSFHPLSLLPCFPLQMEGFESHISSLLAPNPMWSNGFLYCTMCYELKKKGNVMITSSQMYVHKVIFKYKFKSTYEWTAM